MADHDVRLRIPATRQRDPELARAQAIAAAELRHRRERIDALRTLDPVAVEVANAAYAAGRTDVLMLLRELIGAAALSVDPRELLRELEHRSQPATALRFDPGVDEVSRAPGAPMVQRPPDDRAASLVFNTLQWMRDRAELKEDTC